MTGLNLNTQYYVRAYATNSSGIAYGDQVSFITLNTPTITTKTISYIQDSIATCGGIVTSDGGGALINKGICWSVSQNPTINDNITIDTSSQTDFTCVMTGLIPNTAYYVRAFATNGGGTAYGQQKVFVTSAVDGQPCINTATVMDYDSNTYNTVQIGLQCWMKENLRTTHYSNGEEIALGAGAVPSYPRLYYPGNNSSNVPTYGYLYNLAAVLHKSVMWVNGAIRDIQVNTGLGSRAMAVAELNGKPYVVLEGWIGDAWTGSYQGFAWYNEQVTNLSACQSPKDVFVHGSDVYIAGINTSFLRTAVVLKNLTKVNLSTTTTYSACYAVFVK